MPEKQASLTKIYMIFFDIIVTKITTILHHPSE